MHDDPGHRYQNAHEVMNALAGLPMVPDWACIVQPDEVRWTSEIGGRRRVVLWTKHSERRYEWRAWSEPTGAGVRNRTLGRSQAVVGYKQSVRELEAFFL
jgi:hypothetical protein